MSILDDENILIEKTKDSCNLIKPLEEILEDFSITSTMDTAKSEKCEEFFNKLSRLKIDSYRWTRYFDRFVLYDKETLSAALIIFFDKFPQFCADCFDSKYTIKLKIIAYNYMLSEELLSNFISLFDLNNDQMWEAKRSFNFRPDYPHTTYKYVKK